MSDEMWNFDRTMTMGNVETELDGFPSILFCHLYLCIPFVDAVHPAVLVHQLPQLLSSTQKYQFEVLSK